MRFLKHTQIDFLGKNRIASILSAALILTGFIFLLINKGPKLSIEFEGGTLIQIKFHDKVDLSALRQALQTLNLEKSEIQSFGTQNEVLIRLQTKQETELLLENLKNALLTLLPHEVPDFRKVESIGPKIGAELSGKALLAIVISIIGILIYISFRFELKFAVGAIIALIHDVLVILSFFFILNYEISQAIIAALLTIVGYSLNDTIVIFDRVRENLKLYKQEPLNTLFNRSINETLSRTLITAFTTFAIVFILWLLGGEVTKYFAFALVVGVISGTYSTVFIASPIVLFWTRKFAAKKS